MSRWGRGFGTLLLAAVVAAGAGAAFAARRQPPPPPPKKGPVEYMKSLLPWTEVGSAPDFVRDSRPAHLGPFMPAGTYPPEQPLRVKSEAELAAAAAGMEQARAAHESLRAHPPTLTAAAAPPPPPPPPVAPAKTAPKKKRIAKRKPSAAAAND